MMMMMTTAPAPFITIADAEHEESTVTHSQVSKTIQVQIQEEKDRQGTEQSADTQYQEVSYRRFYISEKTPGNPTGLKIVDFETALENMLNLGIADPKYKSKEYAFAVFYNHTTLESIDVLRVSSDTWQVSAPVFIIDTNYRNTHMSRADSRRLTDVFQMFFGGTDWQSPLRMHYDSLSVQLNLEIEQNGGKMPDSWATCPEGPDGCPYCR